MFLDHSFRRQVLRAGVGSIGVGSGNFVSESHIRIKLVFSKNEAAWLASLKSEGAVLKSFEMKFCLLSDIGVPSPLF